jgi:hypothetical protein
MRNFSNKKFGWNNCQGQQGTLLTNTKEIPSIHGFLGSGPPGFLQIKIFQYNSEQMDVDVQCMLDKY